MCLIEICCCDGNRGRFKNTQMVQNEHNATTSLIVPDSLKDLFNLNQ